MSDSPIITVEVGGSTVNAVNSILSNDVKEELVGDDVMLFNADEMDIFSEASANFSVTSRMANGAIATGSNDCESHTFNVQAFDEASLACLISTNNFGKYPVDLSQVAGKFGAVRNDDIVSHYVKYKVEDGKELKIWICGVCSKEFGHQYTLMRHLPTHTDERRFQCNICGKAFRQMSTLSQHRAIHSTDRPYVCELCQKTFNRVSTLISHRKTHTGVKPHSCHLCNKAFHQKGNLRNHIFTHTNERPYKCDICMKGFNQMSNLMCHKLKAHQRADKPRYICQTCGKDFQKRMGLRNHEQYQHGVDSLGPSTSTPAPSRVTYTSGVLVNSINTAAMQHALSTNQTPFALLRPLNGIPVLVRVLAATESQQMLVPATAEDLKKYGQITITEEKDKKNGETDVIEVSPEKPAFTDEKLPGSTVQIKIPVVATVVQRCGEDGNVCMAVESPGPNGEGKLEDNYIFTTSTDKPNEQEINMSIPINNGNTFEGNINQALTQIHYANEYGYLINEEGNFKILGTTPQNSQQQHVNILSGNMQLDPNVVNLTNNHHDIVINSQNVLNINYPNATAEQLFEILDKPQMMPITENDRILPPNNILYETTTTPNYIIP